MSYCTLVCCGQWCNCLLEDTRQVHCNTRAHISFSIPKSPESWQSPVSREVPHVNTQLCFGRQEGTGATGNGHGLELALPLPRCRLVPSPLCPLWWGPSVAGLRLATCSNVKRVEVPLSKARQAVAGTPSSSACPESSALTAPKAMRDHTGHHLQRQNTTTCNTSHKSFVQSLDTPALPM